MATINESSMRSSIFQALFTTIDANKPSGWTVRAKMPQVSSINSYLPLLVFDVRVTSTELVDINKTLPDYFINADFFFVAADTHNGMKDLDTAIDTVREVLRNNQSTWQSSGFYITNIREEASDMEVEGGNRLLTGALSCQIKPILPSTSS